MNTKLTFAMMAAMALGLAGCGDGDQGEPTEQAKAPRTSAAKQDGDGRMDAAREQMQAAKVSAAEAGDQAAAAIASAAQAVGALILRHSAWQRAANDSTKAVD